MSLTLLVSQEKWQDFDQAWSELIKSGGPIDDLVVALRVLGEKKRLPRALATVREHAAQLGKSGRSADAARVLGTAVAGGASAELLPALIEQATQAWGSEPWYPHYTQIAGLLPGQGDGRRAWNQFERLVWMQQGNLLFHPGGWGVGEIEELHVETLEILVRFKNSRRDRFPLHGAVEIFESLAEEDLRARHFRDPDALRKAVKDEPLEVLKAILLRYSGRANNNAIKNAMVQIGIDGSSFSGWWRKARKLAETSPWFRVIGSPAKGEILLLHAELDPMQDLRRSVGNLPTLSMVLARVRDQLGSTKDPGLRGMLLDVLEERTRESKSKSPTALAAWLLLRKERGSASPELLAILAQAAAEPAPADASQPPVMWALFRSLESLQDQERCLLALQDAFAEQWVEQGLKGLRFAPAGLARPLSDALLKAGQAAELAAQYQELMTRPLRAPDAFVALSRLAEEEKLGIQLQPALTRAQALLSLATYLFLNRKQEASAAASQERLVQLLVGTKGKDKGSVLRRLLKGATHEQLSSLQTTIKRGVDEDIDTLFTEIYMRAEPSHAASAESGNAFWEDGRTWTTKKGLERRRGELRHIMEVKIPANTEAIGKAAAMGDLSENSEWESAIEEQRNLTSRASEMEQELRNVELIENAILSEGFISPGTRVRYLEVEKGLEAEISILGPWDTEGETDHVVSYRAPLAAGLLGHREGEELSIQLPGGLLKVKILSVKPLHFP
jgi:transcription elongation GreA/GreB family factor